MVWEDRPHSFMNESLETSFKDLIMCSAEKKDYRL